MVLRGATRWRFGEAEGAGCGVRLLSECRRRGYWRGAGGNKFKIGSELIIESLGCVVIW